MNSRPSLSRRTAPKRCQQTANRYDMKNGLRWHFLEVFKACSLRFTERVGHRDDCIARLGKPQIRVQSLGAMNQGALNRGGA